MPVQTPKTANVYFPDGTEVAVKAAGDVSYFDVGAISSSVTNTLEYDENQVNTANAGQLLKQIRNMTMSGGFTLINLEQEGIEKMGGGIFERTTTTDTPVTTNLTDQVIAASWPDVTAIDLEIINSSTNDNYIASALSLTSVTGDVTGALVADDDYTLVSHPNSRSNFAILLNTNGTSGVSTTEEITIVFASVTPIVSTTIYAGASTKILSAYAMRFRHTDDNGLLREVEIFSADANSGGFQFNFKGANEEGTEEMPITYTGKLDTDRTNNRQLFAWTTQTGAQ